ncbi:MAG: hypothetical protein J6D16_06235 [Clostridia bacterium]|nr:hypothetical protein [Clostridia bacterium]
MKRMILIGFLCLALVFSVGCGRNGHEETTTEPASIVFPIIPLPSNP